MNEVINPYSLDAIYRDYYFDRMMRVLNDMCNVTGHLAIPASKLTSHMRRKYKDQRVKLSRHTFYVFKQDEIPHDIYYKIIHPSLNLKKQA